MPFSWAYFDNQEDNSWAGLLSSAIKCIYWVSCLLNCVSRNVMNAHWKTQISKLLTLEVQRMMMNITVLWCLPGTTELPRSFWVSRHQAFWYYNWRRDFCSLQLYWWGGEVWSSQQDSENIFYFHKKCVDIAINTFPEW